MTKHKRVRINIEAGKKKQENTMAGSWHDFLYSQPASYIGSSGAMGGEHTYGYYIADGAGGAAAQIVMCPNATPPDRPDPQYTSPDFHYAQKPIYTGEPQAAFDSSGICTKEGWTPGGIEGGYYLVGDRTGQPTGTPPGAASDNALANLQAASLNYASSLGMKK